MVSEKTILKRMQGKVEPKTPIGYDLFLPNHSGIASHPEAQNNFLKTNGWTKGDIFYADANGDVVRLPKGTANQYLRISNTTQLPDWENINIPLTNAFDEINCPSGTDPTASGYSTLNLTTSNSSLTITGNSSTDTINFDINLAYAPTWTGVHTHNANIAMQTGQTIRWDTLGLLGIVGSTAGSGSLTFGAIGGAMSILSSTFTSSVGYTVNAPSDGNSATGFAVAGFTGLGVFFHDYTGAGAGGAVTFENNSNLYHQFGVVSGTTLGVGDVIHTDGTNSLNYDASTNILKLSNNNGAVQLPQMTTTQRNAMTAVNGMMIYNTTTGQTEKYSGGAWAAF